MKDSNLHSPKTNALKELLALPDAEKERLGAVHTPREIAQQPSTWLTTFERIAEKQSELQEFLADAGLGDDGFIVTLIGAGTSDYIGRAIAPLLRKQWRCNVQTVPSTDLMTEMDDVVDSAPEGSKHLWISFSRSGDSFEGVKAIRDALVKYPEINHLIITCNSTGQMATSIAVGRPNVFCISLDGRANDLGLAMTSSFTNMVVAGHCIAHIADLDEYQPIVKSLADAAEAVLPNTADLASAIAEKKFSRICFLGTGALKAVCDESSLKTTELTDGGFSTMSESFLGLRHGPLSWLNDNSLVVGFLSNNVEKRRVELGLLAEVREKAAARCILTVLPQENLALSVSSDFNLVLNIPETLSDLYRPPLDVLFAQCLGLFASLRIGLKPDTPSSSGKIKRVVSSITFA